LSFPLSVSSLACGGRANSFLTYFSLPSTSFLELSIPCLLDCPRCVFVWSCSVSPPSLHSLFSALRFLFLPFLRSLFLSAFSPPLPGLTASFHSRLFLSLRLCPTFLFSSARITFSFLPLFSPFSPSLPTSPFTPLVFRGVLSPSPAWTFPPSSHLSASLILLHAFRSPSRTRLLIPPPCRLSDVTSPGL